MKQKYPLQWPVGYPRTRRPEASRFERRSLTVAKNAVKDEVARLGGTRLIISTNIQLRADGEPRADYQKRSITDFGVAVYFHRNGKEVVLACDRWASIEENLWAISKSIEAMRGLERWGVSDILERTFTGFAALPEATASRRNHWDVLGTVATRDVEALRQRHRELRKKRHPDAGGSHEAFIELEEAFQAALVEIQSHK